MLGLETALGQDVPVWTFTMSSPLDAVSPGPYLPGKKWKTNYVNVLLNEDGRHLLEIVGVTPILKPCKDMLH